MINILTISIVLFSLISGQISPLVRFNELSDNWPASINTNQNEAIGIEDDWQGLKIYPVPTPYGQLAYTTSFKAVTALDRDSGTVLYQTNQDQRLPVASLTKLMTAYVVLKSYNPSDKLTVSNYQLMDGDSRIGLRVGDSLTVKSLLQGLLIKSGSDAAQVLADNFPGGRTAFVEKMNHSAKSLGLANSQFDNPVGWDSPKNYSSSYDLTILARVLINNQLFSDIVKTSATNITSEQGNSYYLANTNLLLPESGFLGIKTGYTDQANGCLASLYDLNGHSLIVVVLGSADRFGDSRRFLDWINLHFLW